MTWSNWLAGLSRGVRPESGRTEQLNSVEPMEARLLLSAMPAAAKKPAKATPVSTRDLIYVLSNNPEPGQNAVLGYRQNGAGKVKPIRGGPFLTGGTGFYVDDERLGPDDSDQELLVSADGRFLFAVNSGSGTVASFSITQKAHRGRLKFLGAFNSGGDNPVSLGQSGQFLFVINKSNQDPGETAGDNPNITTLRINNDGILSPVAGGTVELPAGVQPTQAMVSPDGKHLFNINLFEFPFPPPPGFPPFAPPYASRLVSYNINPNGTLTEADSETAPTPPPYILGMDVHPTEKILYAGYVLGAAMGTYTYNDAGQLTYVGSSSIGTDDFGICWIEVSSDGKYAYSSNSTTDTISVFSLADPLHPVEIQSVLLNGPRGSVPQPAPVLFGTTPFQLELDPENDFLYVVNHETTLEDNFPEGNALHVLKVGSDGKLTELTSSPVVFPTSLVPPGAHPKGVVVL